MVRYKKRFFERKDAKLQSRDLYPPAGTFP
jgi:hypothetical protein